MLASTSDFSAWLEQASIRESALSAEQLGLLRAAFQFRQPRAEDTGGLVCHRPEEQRSQRPFLERAWRRRIPGRVACR
jgi:hypothetical protein